VSPIDLRSDTVTHPTAEMRRAMAEAEVGDDVWRDDPTAIALEERAAEILGKEAALFVPSGSQGNLVCQMALVARGQEIIAGSESHVVLDEAASHAVVVGASVRSIVEQPDGTLDPDEVAAAFRDPLDEHEPITGLVALENTNTHAGGKPLTPEYTARIAAIAHERGAFLHVDGARLWHAAVALGRSPAELVAAADSVSACLSKGLACPIGSVVAGSAELVWRARRARKLLGGGMRQVGIVAAAGLVALRDGPTGMIERLAVDHEMARRLAEGLAELPDVHSPGGFVQPEPGPLDPDRFPTNVVIFRVSVDRGAFLEALTARGVWLSSYGHGTIRAVTHHGIATGEIDAALAAMRDVLADLRSGPRSIATAGASARA
jgi:threonine aldolase